MRKEKILQLCNEIDSLKQNEFQLDQQIDDEQQTSETIQKELEDPISELIIDSFENPISTISVMMDDEKIKVTAE